MAAKPHDCGRWLDLYVTPEGVMVEYCEHGERRDRQLSKEEAVAAHVRVQADPSRRLTAKERVARAVARAKGEGYTEDAYNPDELRQRLEKHFDEQGLT